MISSRLGYRKPERRMFEHALDLMGLRSDEVVYVGDSVVPKSANQVGEM